MARFDRLLDSPHVTRWASAASLILGLVFVFVWAPHPWGWQGIDSYHELARALARGEPFPTTDVPWGYAYFVAAFYALFGDRPLIPVVAQVVVNATLPFLLYRLLRPFTDQRTAALATVLVGLFSFNTIYASTQSSDSICTVLFIGSLLCFARGYRRESLVQFAVGGILAGLVPQFRPNMLLLPVVIAGLYLLVRPRGIRRALQTALFLTTFALALMPWVLRNHALTGMWLPTSTHGGVQLWYGSLQVGDYLESRAHNPRSLFEPATFDYTSLANQPIIVWGERARCEDARVQRVELVYWTDRTPQPRRIAAHGGEGDQLTFEIPGQTAPTTLYYYFESTFSEGPDGTLKSVVTPTTAPQVPLVYFIADDHLTDLDRRSDLLDIFDLTRLIRHLAWGEPAPSILTAFGIHATGEEALKTAVVQLLGDGATPHVVSVSPLLEVTDDAATLRLSDGSTLTVPKHFTDRVTDLDIRGRLAGSLIPARRPRHLTEQADRERRQRCAAIDTVQLNEVFYRREPHQMQRYLALAIDNISRDPATFLQACLYRMGRLFVIRGSDDQKTTQQFVGSRYIYVAGLLLSAAYLLLFAVGVAIAARLRSRLLIFLLPIVYVPLTICFVLTNMRYTVTVQPLMFAFIAVAATALVRKSQRRFH